MAVHRYFQGRGFIQVHTPIITASDCEGAGEAFSLATMIKDLSKDEKPEPFFGKDAYLTVSGQLQAEILASAMGRVYTFGPTFRAEGSDSTRHLAEFWMLEPEMAFCDLNGCMEEAEGLVKYLIEQVLSNSEEDLLLFHRFVEKGLIDRLKLILNQKFERISYSDAINILIKSNSKFEFKPEYGSDLQREHEKYLCEHHFKKPVFVTDWPKEIKAFYMKLNQDKKTVAAMDLLVPGVGELIGGSAREDDHDVLKQAMEKLNHDGSYDWYLDLRKYGSFPHAGFGLGFERFIQFVTGMKNIKDTIPLPRSKRHLQY
eukprot:TRINITY_DN8131_c0_g1_i1.p1 TRINITY_DN8131_c0_g1~~TRINITY_DN8131_c0_g1_i1.p1  ORF type:complete len:315 (-),score=73.77 TRINITY_DN8131_c0_g1_i1:34-978(-)